MKTKALATLTALTLVLSAPGLCWSQTAGDQAAPYHDKNYAPPPDSALHPAGKGQQPAVTAQPQKSAQPAGKSAAAADTGSAPKEDLKEKAKDDKDAKKTSKSKSDADEADADEEDADDGIDYHAVKAAAMAGDVNAQTILAGLYEHGTGVDQNYALAAKWYEIAARSGSPTAQASYDTVIKEEQGLVPNNVPAGGDRWKAATPSSKDEKQK